MYAFAGRPDSALMHPMPGQDDSPATLDVATRLALLEHQMRSQAFTQRLGVAVSISLLALGLYQTFRRPPQSALCAYELADL